MANILWQIFLKKFLEISSESLVRDNSKVDILWIT